MSLWLEARDDKGVVTFRGRFRGGLIDLYEQEAITLDQAVKMARQSTHLPLPQREWVLRIGPND